MTSVAANLSDTALVKYKPVKFTGNEGSKHYLRIFTLANGTTLSLIADLAGHMFDEDLSQFQPEMKWSNRVVVDISTALAEEKTFLFNYQENDQVVVSIKEEWANGCIYLYPINVYNSGSINGKELRSAHGLLGVNERDALGDIMTIPPVKTLGHAHSDPW